MRGRQSWSPTR